MIRVLRKLFSKQFCFIRFRRQPEDNTSGPLNRRDIADLTLLRTLLAIRQKSREPRFWEVIDSFVLLAHASLAASRNLLQLSFRIRRFVLLVQTKKVISMNYDSITSSWKSWRWVRIDLIFSMRDIYINANLNPFTKFTSSSRIIILFITNNFFYIGNHINIFYQMFILQ